MSDEYEVNRKTGVLHREWGRWTILNSKLNQATMTPQIWNVLHDRVLNVIFILMNFGLWFTQIDSIFVNWALSTSALISNGNSIDFK